MSSRARVVGSLLFAFVLGLAPPGLVLCVAEGDHVAIETACELRPCSAPSELAQSAFGEPVESCTDTPLLSAALRTSSDPVPVALPSAVLTSAALRAAVPALPFRAGDARSSELRSIRTIVLLV